MRFRSIVGATALTLTAALSACGSTDSSAGSDGKTTVDVWLMRDSVSSEFQQKFEADFEADHPDIDANIQIQEWDGIGEKVVAALASNDAPDVIEVGNTQAAQYAASGGLRDLSDKVAELGGEDWLDGLAEPANHEGAQYGVPYYAASRVVVYRKDLFEAKGIDASTIKTREQWIDATTTLNSGGTQGIYLPGQNWHVLAGFIWDEGGTFAVQSGGQWEGALDSPEAMSGMAFYQELQALGQGPRDSDVASPPQTDVMAQGEVAQIIAAPGAADLVVEANPELEGKLGFFPIPGKTADTPGAVFVGGSVLVIPTASSDPDAATTFIKELAGDEWQRELAATMSYVPNKTTLVDAVEDDPGAAAMAVGASQNGHTTPIAPGWATVESENLVHDYMTAVLTGGDPAQEAASASEAISRAMNSAS
ncbi:carbohydrate ABC transporter substrate-binding protein (CUT1 family) [Haloactinopolyspora alba]|uniref:Carbohydrate ABC transporter substrate-binding protein (CUT1 family) n=1 Tax=Haloactinopolyspora alba TaxID=648780 RepID=A0A2P8D3Y8_9ACTN|nr:extracellular solute-binding protein [Haloactinopolyspora alba]PSK91889.1 carbohydrate ABC transporter substrate-binding protein (CUT1 family) [Haloactinopolyspora alba]